MRTICVLGVLLASVSEAQVVVRTNEPGEMTNLTTGETTSFSSSEPILLPKEPALLSMNNRFPVLVLTPHGTNSEIRINPPQRSASGNSYEKDLSQLLEGYTAVRAALQGKNAHKARVEINGLRRSFPSVRFLSFLEANVCLLEGNSARAIEHLKTGLKAHPNFEEGKQLLQKLEGA